MRAVVFALMAAVLGVVNHSDAQACRIEPVPQNAVTIDGQLDEWHSMEFDRVGTANVGELKYAFGFDEGGLYVAAVVADDRFIRSPFPSPTEDAVVLTWLTPHGTALDAKEVWLYAGVPGRIRAQGAIGTIGAKPRPVPAIRIVEAPVGQSAGYSFEAFIPWSVFGREPHFFESRCAIRLQDVDSEAHPLSTISASFTVDSHALTEVPRAMFRDALGDAMISFLDERGVPMRDVVFDERANVTGDNVDERIVIARRVLALMSVHEGQGSYAYTPFMPDTDTHFVSGELRDVTGDGLAELIAHLQRVSGERTDDIVEIWTFEGGMARIFVHVEKRTEHGTVTYDGKFHITAHPHQSSVLELVHRVVGARPGHPVDTHLHFSWDATTRAFGTPPTRGEAPIEYEEVPAASAN